MSYPFLSIWINGRNVSIEHIIRGKISFRSAFEESTFLFIREWFTDKEKFTLHTSGSTGEPKAITITREQMIASARLSETALQLKKFYNALVCLDTRYIAGKMMLVRSFITGMRVLAVDPCSCPLHKIPVDLCVNFAAFVPFQVQNTLGSKHPHLLDGLDTLIIGGAPIDGKTIEQLDAFLCRCYATYGMTEAISHIALKGLNGKWKQDNYETLPGITVQQDERGCLVIDAPYMPDKVVTNDVVELLTPQKFRWLGRWDNVINTAGVKVVPEKIEAVVASVLKNHNVSNRFFIQGIEDDKFGSKVALIIEGDDSIRSVAEAAVKNLKGLLTPYEIPKEILTVPAFVTTASGKLNRQKTAEATAHFISIKK